MTTQPDPNASNASWSWSVQTEMDSFQRAVNQRLSDMTTRVGTSVTSVEYAADKRTSDLQLSVVNNRIDDVEVDISVVKVDLVKSVDELKRDNAAEHSRLAQAIQDEVTARQTQNKEDAAARQSQFRWMISAVLIPIVLAVMDLLLNKK